MFHHSVNNEVLMTEFYYTDPWLYSILGKLDPEAEVGTKHPIMPIHIKEPEVEGMHPHLIPNDTYISQMFQRRNHGQERKRRILYARPQQRTDHAVWTRAGEA